MIFKKNQNQKLLKNIERYEEEKTKQQKPKVLGQKTIKRKDRKEKSTRLHNS